MQLFQSRLRGEPTDYLILVNRQPVPQDYVLVECDRVSITPTRIEGAVVTGGWRLKEPSGSASRV